MKVTLQIFHPAYFSGLRFPPASPFCSILAYPYIELYALLQILFYFFYCRKILHRQIVGNDSSVEKMTIFVANGEST